jgi:hypothetical protein
MATEMALASFQVITRAQRTRVHVCPQHWLLCHMGLYMLEFEFELAFYKVPLL